MLIATTQTVHDYLFDTRGTWHKMNILSKIFNVKTPVLTKLIQPLIDNQGLRFKYLFAFGMVCGYHLEFSKEALIKWLKDHRDAAYTPNYIAAIFDAPVEDILSQLVILESEGVAKRLVASSNRRCIKYIYAEDPPIEERTAGRRTFKRDTVYGGFPRHVLERLIIKERNYSVPHDNDGRHFSR